MGRYIDVIGHKFGMLTVLERVIDKKYGRPRLKFKCDCGNIVIRNKSDVVWRRSKRIQSCGCLNKEISSKLMTKMNIANTKHGKCKNGATSRAYRAWSHVIQRCTNKNNTAYNDYGGRGISVCDKWCKFENFSADMGEPPTDKHTLDRIDVNGNYEPVNCRWATMYEQARNKRSTIMITFGGITQCYTDWQVFLRSLYKEQAVNTGRDKN